MSEIATLRKKIDELEKLADEIQELGVEILENVNLDVTHSSYGYLKKFDYRSLYRKKQSIAVTKYQQWYSTVLSLVRQYADEWIGCFEAKYSTGANNSHYHTNGIMDYLELGKMTFFTTKEKVINDFLADFDIQRSILLSILPIIEVKEQNLRKIITTDIAKIEVEQAELLLVSGFERAAGSIAGVTLELHLKTLCDINGVLYPPKATIDPLAQALYKGGKLDTTELKYVQYLASIRNKCSHPNPVSTAEIQALIDGVKKLI